MKPSVLEHRGPGRDRNPHYSRESKDGMNDPDFRTDPDSKPTRHDRSGTVAGAVAFSDAAMQSLTPPRFVSISGYRHLAERLGCLALPTYRHARFRPFSKNRSTDEGADPSVLRSSVRCHKGISPCIRELCSHLTGKTALVSFSLPMAAMTSSTPGVGRAF